MTDFLPEKHTDFIFTLIAEKWAFGLNICIMFICNFDIFAV